MTSGTRGNRAQFIEEEIEIDVAVNTDVSGVGKLGDLGEGNDYGGL